MMYAYHEYINSMYSLQTFREGPEPVLDDTGGSN